MFAPSSYTFPQHCLFHSPASHNVLTPPFSSQDVISYVIARTLGVIDDTKASTSSTVPVPATAVASSTIDPCTGAALPPSIRISDDPATEDDAEDNLTPMSTPPPTYFHSTMESAGNLKLSGVDMFSPAPSQPPSPTLSRKDLSVHLTHQLQPMSKIVAGSSEKGSGEVTPGSSHSSISVGSSFAFPGDSGSEDGLQIRQRRPGVAVDA